MNIHDHNFVPTWKLNNHQQHLSVEEVSPQHFLPVAEAWYAHNGTTEMKRNATITFLPLPLRTRTFFEMRRPVGELALAAAVQLRLARAAHVDGEKCLVADRANLDLKIMHQH